MFETVSLRTKLIAMVTIILVAGFTASNFFNYQVSKGAMRATVLENELPLSSNNVYSQIQADILRPVFISDQMAQDTFLRDWAIEGEVDADRMTRYLDSIRTRYDEFTSYFISAKTLRYYHFTGPTDTLDETNPEDLWFFHIRDRDRKSVV